MGLQDLSSLTRDRTYALAAEVQSLTHWTAGGAPGGLSHFLEAWTLQTRGLVSWPLWAERVALIERTCEAVPQA